MNSLVCPDILKNGDKIVIISPSSKIDENLIIGEKKHLESCGLQVIVAPHANGDGVIFVNEKGTVDGFRINKVEANKIFPASNVEIEKGTILYRNYDQLFEKELDRKSAERKIRVHFLWKEVKSGFEMLAEDERGCMVSKVLNIEKTRNRFAVLAAAKYRSEFTRSEFNCRKNPFCRIVGGIAQRIIQEVDGIVANV